jgi:hypothetical protein
MQWGDCNILYARLLSDVWQYDIYGRYRKLVFRCPFHGIIYLSKRKFGKLTPNEIMLTFEENAKVTQGSDVVRQAHGDVSRYVYVRS